MTVPRLSWSEAASRADSPESPWPSNPGNLGQNHRGRTAAFPVSGESAARCTRTQHFRVAGGRSASCSLGRLGIRQRPVRDPAAAAHPSPPPHSPAVAPHPHGALARRDPPPGSADLPVPVPDHGTAGPRTTGALPRLAGLWPRPQRLRVLTRVSPACRGQLREPLPAPPPARPLPHGQHWRPMMCVAGPSPSRVNSQGVSCRNPSGPASKGSRLVLAGWPPRLEHS